MDKQHHLQLVKATHEKLPVSMRSYFATDEAGGLAPIQMAPSPVLRQRAKELFLMFGTTPGLVDRPLTEAEKARLTPFEIATYNLWLRAIEDGCEFDIIKYLNDMVIGPPTQKHENVNLNGNVKDWREVLTENVAEIEHEMAQARELEKKKWEAEQAAYDQDIVDATVKQTEPQGGEQNNASTT